MAEVVDETNQRSNVGQEAARVALAVGVVAVASVASLVLFFAVGGPFGAANDLGNALIGVLSGLLAFRLAVMRGTRTPAVAAAVIGAAVTIIGSWLVMTDTTGFFLASLVSSLGFALIGAWLVAFIWSAPSGALPSGLRTLGWVAGVAMLLGLVGVPGIVLGIDDMEAAPPWLWAFGISWLGTYVLYPAWSLWLARGP
jgi:hypothetical protein